MKTTKKLLSKSVITSLAALLLPLGAQATSDDAQKMHKLYEENCASCQAQTMAGLLPSVKCRYFKRPQPHGFTQHHHDQQLSHLNASVI